MSDIDEEEDKMAMAVQAGLWPLGCKHTCYLEKDRIY